MTTYVELNKGLTEEESSLKEQIHRFAAEVFRPAAMELDPAFARHVEEIRGALGGRVAALTAS